MLVVRVTVVALAGVAVERVIELVASDRGVAVRPRAHEFVGDRGGVITREPCIARVSTLGSHRKSSGLFMRAASNEESRTLTAGSVLSAQTSVETTLATSRTIRRTGQAARLRVLRRRDTMLQSRISPSSPLL